ncbi:phage tail assembly protein [Vibrio coralliilyticus]|uniref:phage tail assembly protein n=1 Tax=Vibrio coralliilyticus TaxID=190893 RepID=UPI000A3E516A|nr:phage tail assembly protein [Vibrio coralliilyticus]
MLNNTSTLKFFSCDHDQSKKLEAQLAELKGKIKAVTEETPEQELEDLQSQIDKLQVEVKALRTVELKTLPIAEFKRLPHIKLDEKEMTHLQIFEQRKATILKCSELTEKQFAVIKAPDFHKLYADICEFVLTPADLAQGNVLNTDKFEFDLLHPFSNEVEEQIKHIRFNVPLTSHSEALAELVDDEEREDFMFRVVTGLEKSDFEYLSTNDYLALKPQVGAFF